MSRSAASESATGSVSPIPTNAIREDGAPELGLLTSLSDDDVVLATSTDLSRTPSRFRKSIHSSINAIGSIGHRLAERNLESVVNKIGRIRRHHESSVCELHRDQSGRRLTQDEVTKLEGLCDKLVDHSSFGRPTEQHASTEILRLSVIDPYLRSLLRNRQLLHPDSYEHRARFVVQTDGAQFSTVDDATEGVHAVWSGLLKASHDYEDTRATNEASEYIVLHHRSLVDSLRHRGFSHLAARYLCHALKLPVTGNALFLLIKLWHCYMDLATDDQTVIEWSILNECFGNIPQGDFRIAFASPNRLATFAAPLKRFWNDLPNMFRVFFGLPGINFDENPDLSYLDFTNTRMSVHKSHFRLLPSYRQELLEKVGFDNSHDAFKDTVLGDYPLWAEYSELASRVIERYRIGVQDSYLRGSQLLALRFEAFNNPQSIDKQTLAMFFIACIYCHCWQFELHRDKINIDVEALDTVRDLIGTPRLPHFDNVPYLRRYIVGGRLHITADDPPPHTIIEDIELNRLRTFSVDTMVLRENSMLLWLRIDGTQEPFHSISPHHRFPISAGYDETNWERQYVAAVKAAHVYYFTCVADGASTAKYTDEVGDEHEANEFFVLAQVLEDDDRQLRWCSFWPEKDPEYRPASESAMNDDKHLESLLNSYFGNEERVHW